MEKCVMCKLDFEAGELDFLGRCTPCFVLYVGTPEEERPNLGIAYTPVSKAVK